MSLEPLRKRIDALDAGLVALLRQRAETALAIGAEKRRQQVSIQDPAREEEVLARVCRQPHDPMSEADLRSIFREIMGVCARLQQDPGARPSDPGGAHGDI